ncbi:MAG: M20 family metallopeptidase, partial [Solirubrobacterales bacterium]
TAPAGLDHARAGEILSDLRSRTGEMTEMLTRLAEAESPSGNRAAQARPTELIGAELRLLGFEVQRVPGKDVGDHLLADAIDKTDGRPMQLLLGHLDTVWPIGTIDAMPIRADEGRLHGPGVYDMKGGIVQMLFALSALRERGHRPSLSPIVFINTDEEIGSPESRGHIERLATQAARVFVLEPSFGPAGSLKTARKGVGRFVIQVTGRASHAGLDPEAGRSAILEVTHQIQALFALNDADRGITVNVGTIDGGTEPNVVAPEVKAIAEARAVTAADAEELEHRIRGLRPIGEGVTIAVEGGFGRAPMERNHRNGELWVAAEHAAGLIGIEISEALVGGASDGNTASPHAPTLDGLGPVGGGAHAQHEHVVIDRLPERAALLAVLLMHPPPENPATGEADIATER